MFVQNNINLHLAWNKLENLVVASANQLNSCDYKSSELVTNWSVATFYKRTSTKREVTQLCWVF